MLFLACVGPCLSAQAQDNVIWTTDGDCHELIIADEDLTSRCNSALAQMLHADGRLITFVGLGWSAEIGYLFAGAPVGRFEPWAPHRVDSILIQDAARQPSLTEEQVEGRCDFSTGTAINMDVHCTATDTEGRRYLLRYRTDDIGPSRPLG